MHATAHRRPAATGRARPARHRQSVLGSLSTHEIVSLVSLVVASLYLLYGSGTHQERVVVSVPILAFSQLVTLLSE